MDAITQAEIFALIAEVNAFADSSETLINNSRSTYDRNMQKYLRLTPEGRRVHLYLRSMLIAKILIAIALNSVHCIQY